MRIESIRLKNFKSFKDAEIKNLPPLSIFVGANGSGKSSFFQALEFLKTAVVSDVTSALELVGGFDQARTRGNDDDLLLKFLFDGGEQDSSLNYVVEVGQENEKPAVKLECLSAVLSVEPWEADIYDFSNGTGHLEFAKRPEPDATRDFWTPVRLKAPDRLALGVIGQFDGSGGSEVLASFIEGWHFADLNGSSARPYQQSSRAEHLSRDGSNLSLVLDYYHREHRKVFDGIIDTMRRAIPSLRGIEVKVTEDGRVLLRFKDGPFEDPFLARDVSDGTIELLCYLTLLHDPSPFPLICVEEPERHIYPKLLPRLLEEFRAFAERGGQVFVSTHSSDFLNAAEPQEVFWLVKKDGSTEFRRASDDAQIMRYVHEGETLGPLWREGFFEGGDA